MHLSLFPAVRLAVLLPTLPSERAVTFEATVLPCCFGRDANPRTARRILIRLRARVFYISRQINLGPLGCGPLRERVWHLCRSSSRGARSRSRSALGLRPRLSPRFARPSLRSAAIPFPVLALPAPARRCAAQYFVGRIQPPRPAPCRAAQSPNRASSCLFARRADLFRASSV